MSWICLFIAGIFETGWPFGFKMAQISPHKLFWIVFSVITMSISGYLLFIAQKTIPIGIAYAIWTGIGTISTFLIGLYVFHDTASVFRFLGIILILSGIVILRLSA